MTKQLEMSVPDDVPAQPVCIVCSASISEAMIGPMLCDNRKCRRVWLGQSPVERQRAHNRAIREQARTIADALAPPDCGLPLVILPSNDRSLSALPQSRKDAFVERLHSLYDSVRVDSEFVSVKIDGKAPHDIRTQSLLDSACAACRGHCCIGGGDHAHLDAESLALVIAAREISSWDELKTAYSSYFPTSSFHDSCVFHAEHGCTLPREMRAEICNRYLCGSLTELKRAVESGAEAPFVAVTVNAIAPVRVLKIDQSSAVFLIRAANVIPNIIPMPSTSNAIVEGSGTVVMAEVENDALN